MTLRRIAWVLASLAGIPAIIFGMFYLYSFVVLPLVCAIGMATARSQLGLGVSLGLFSALVVGFAFALGFGRSSDYWWGYLLLGCSALLALLATFKVGMVLRLGVGGSRARTHDPSVAASGYGPRPFDI